MEEENDIVVPAKIDEWSDRYFVCLEDELKSIEGAQDAKDTVEERRQFLLSVGYGPEGSITGKNAEIRAAQEAELLRGDPTYQELKAKHRKAQHEASMCRIRREAYKQRLDLIEAWFKRA